MTCSVLILYHVTRVWSAQTQLQFLKYSFFTCEILCHKAAYRPFDFPIKTSEYTTMVCKTDAYDYIIGFEIRKKKMIQTRNVTQQTSQARNILHTCTKGEKM